MNKIVATCMLCLASSSAMADATTEQEALQASIQTVPYSEDKIIDLKVQVGRVTDIIVSDMEAVKRLVLGKDGRISGLKKEDENQQAMVNNIPIYGDKAGSTDLVLLTSDTAHGGRERTYLFNIKVVEATADGSLTPGVVQRLKFTYPDDVKQAAVQQTKLTWQEKKQQHDMEIARARMNTDVFSGPQNWQYELHGTAKSIAPVQIHDNTQTTGFQYPGNMASAAIFKVIDGVQGKPAVCLGQKIPKEVLMAPEQTVDTQMYDNMVIVHSTAPHWRLRVDKLVIDAFNCNYDPIGYNPGTGTNSPDVWRKVIAPADKDAAK